MPAPGAPPDGATTVWVARSAKDRAPDSARFFAQLKIQQRSLEYPHRVAARCPFTPSTTRSTRRIDNQASSVRPIRHTRIWGARRALGSSMSSSSSTSASPQPVNRRTVLKGVAWATPAVILAATVPAAAASSLGTNSGTLTINRQGLSVTVSVSVTSTQTKTITAIMTVTPAGKGTWTTPNANAQTTGPYPITQVVTGRTSSGFTFPASRKPTTTTTTSIPRSRSRWTASLIRR